MDGGSLRAKCEELLELLHANGDHAKLRRLTADIERLRDRLVSGEPGLPGLREYGPAMDETERDRRRRIAENEVLYRDVNERSDEIRELTRTDSGEALVVLCECGNRACAEQLEVGRPEYEQVRADPTLFIVARGHSIPAVETVVTEETGYEVVRKDREPGRSIAKETDPRDT